jgi:hypothetical protein
MSFNIVCAANCQGSTIGFFPSEELRVMATLREMIKGNSLVEAPVVSEERQLISGCHACMTSSDPFDVTSPRRTPSQHAVA